jgi:hypothetical protein
LTSFRRTLDRRLVAGDHRLLRLVEIHRLHHLALSRFGAGFYTDAASSPMTAAIAPSPDGTAACMALARSSTSGTASAIAALRRQPAPNTRPGCDRRPWPAAPAFFLPQAVNGNPGGQHQGLGIDGLVQLLPPALRVTSCHRSRPSDAEASSKVLRITGCIAVGGHHSQ